MCVCMKIKTCDDDCGVEGKEKNYMLYFLMKSFKDHMCVSAVA